MADRILRIKDIGPTAGAYSPAVIAGGLIFCSGQISQDWSTGELRHLSAAEQTQLALLNLKNVLQAAGSDLNRVVKCQIYISDMADFDAVDKAYRGFFTDGYPARITVQIAGLYAGLKVEIDAIALAV